MPRKQPKYVAISTQDLKSIYGDIELLHCLQRMVWYYQTINTSIRHLAGEAKYQNERFFARMPPDQVRLFRRYINTDLHNLSLEFYLQRVQWASRCKKGLLKNPLLHNEEATLSPARHPCLMRGGFKRLVRDRSAYSYAEFLGETLPIFIAVQNHLASINRALGNLYYYVTEAPFPGFTPSGKTEVLRLTNQMEGLMGGLLVATHLQPQKPWQNDLANFLISSRADCQRLLDTIPRYYQDHRMRLVIFTIDNIQDANNPAFTREPHLFPLACLPWSAGSYLDFLSAYQSIAQHVMAVVVWSLRLHSLWSFVPRRYLRLVAPTLRV